MVPPALSNARLRTALASSFLLPAALLGGPVGAATAAIAPASVGAGDPSPAAAALPKGTEDPSLETAKSRTWVKPNGSRVTRLYGQTVNVKDAHGDWTPIDNTLSRSGGAIVNGEGVTDLTLPTSLAGGPVKLAFGRDSLSLTLQGAGNGAAKIDGDTATYPAVGPDVSAKLSSTNSGVKEDLLLASAKAQHSFTYKVALSAGLELKARKDGGVDAVDGSGKVAFSIAAPLTVDAKGDVASGTESTMSVVGDTITVALDQAWLSAPGRAFPVTLDPSATKPSARDCYLDGANTTTTYCSAADLWVGNSGGHDHKAILNFDLSSVIPEAANIQYADLNLYPNSQTSPGVAKNLSAHEITSPFDNTATWVNRASGTPWTTAGGDIAAADLDSIPLPATGTYAYWNITDLVSGWIDGTKANNGVAVTDDGSTANNSVIFQSFDAPASNDPFIDIDWYPRMGTPTDATMIKQPISSNSTLGVNVAGGNLQLSSTDLKVASTGLPISVGRVYNSQDNLWSGMLGSKGRLTLGNDIVEYKIDNRDDRMVIMPGGARFRFAFDPATSKYKTPAGAGNVTLTRAAPTSGRFTLTDNDSGIKYGWYDGPFAYTDQMTDQYGNTTSFEAHGTGNALSKITDSRGRGYTLTSNSDGFVTSLNVPSTVISGGETWTYAYDAGDDLLRSVTDPVGNVTGYTYTTDGSDLLTKITDARGNDTLIAYNSDQEVTSITRKIDGTTANDITTSFSYKFGAAIDSWCPVANLAATPAPTPKTSGETLVTDPNGKVTTYCWDQEGAVLKTRDALNHDATTTYNPQGNSTKFTSYAGTSGASNNTVTFDGLGQNPKTVTDGAGAINSAVYPTTPGQTDLAASRPSSTTNPQNKTTSYTYNSQGDMLTSQTGTSLKATLTYNTDGTIATAKDGNTNTTTYQYNANHELWKVIPQPLVPPTTANGQAMGTTVYTYDGLSRVATITDANGKVLTFGYDKNNRNTTIADSDGKTTTLGYDANGNLTSRTEGTNTSTYGYDKLNRKTSETFPSSVTNTYTYDKSGNLKTLTDPSGTATYTYDAINRTASVTAPTATTGTDVTSWTYDDPGTTANPDTTHTLTTETLPGGATVKQTNDTAGKLTDLLVKSAGATQTMRRHWNYVIGSTQHELVDSMVDYGAGSTAVTTSGYVYGDNDMLTDAQTINGTAGSNVRHDTFTYDGSGNRTQRVTTLGTGSPTTTTYTYNNDNQLCWQAPVASSAACSDTKPAGATAYTYDAAGNQVTGGVALAYDAKNRLKTLGTDTVTNLAPTNAEVTAIGTSSYQNTVLGVNRITVAGNLAKIVRDPGTGAAVSQVAGGVKRWFVTDQIGSTIALVDNNAAIQKAYAYDVDGNVTTTTPGSGPDTQIKYAGGVDVGNGLYHYGARYYSTAEARWTQPDPLDSAGDIDNANTYLYVSSNSVNFTDPQGQFLKKFRAWFGRRDKAAVSASGRWGARGAAGGLVLGCLGGASAAIGPAGWAGCGAGLGVGGGGGAALGYFKGFIFDK